MLIPGVWAGSGFSGHPSQDSNSRNPSAQEDQGRRFGNRGRRVVMRSPITCGLPNVLIPTDMLAIVIFSVMVVPRELAILIVSLILVFPISVLALLVVLFIIVPLELGRLAMLRLLLIPTIMVAIIGLCHTQSDGPHGGRYYYGSDYTNRSFHFRPLVRGMTFSLTPSNMHAYMQVGDSYEFTIPAFPPM